jgi:hypothetical protein
MILHGNHWKKVQKHIGTRSPSQARSHAQKFFIKIKKLIAQNKPNNGSHSNESIISLIKSFIKNEIIDKLIKLDNRGKYLNIIDNKDKLSQLILLMMSSLCKDKTKEKMVDMDNLNQLDYSFKDEDFINNKSKRTPSAKVNIFHIEKIIRKKPEIPKPVNNIPSIINNHVYTPSRNNYINIVTINVCKNEKENNVEDNPLDMNNFLDFNKSNFLNLFEKGTKAKKPENKTNLINNEIFNLENNRNNINIHFDEAQEEIINNFFLENTENKPKKDEEKDFDIYNFFN